MNDTWVCASCKSINRQRDRQCYHCRASVDEAMTPVGPDLRVESAVANRAARAYLPSWPLAVLAGGLLIAVAILGIVLLITEAQIWPQLREDFLVAVDTGRREALEQVRTGSVALAPLSLLRTGLVLAALGTFAAWLAVATMNVPALGGGYPSRGPIRVFIYTLIPIWNLFKVPGMVQDVLYRVDPRAGGAFMVMAATIGLAGSWLLSIVGGWVIAGAALRSMLEAGSIEAATQVFAGVLDQSFVLGIVTELMVAVGTVLVVVLMARIERRCMARDREIRSQAGVA